MTRTTVFSFPKQSSFQDAIPQSAILIFYILNFISLKQQREKKNNTEWNFMLTSGITYGTVVCIINEATEPCGTGKKGDIFSQSLRANTKLAGPLKQVKENDITRPSSNSQV